VSYERLASFSRLILLDKRGTGLSDRPRELATLETRMDDVRAVFDAVGSERAALLGACEGGQMCALFAATYPERTSAVILYDTPARLPRAPVEWYVTFHRLAVSPGSVVAFQRPESWRLYAVTDA
jgi:pimeloyl-ACP methyl ester carboxylesterase